MRCQVVRNLAHYLTTVDPSTELPLARLLGLTLVWRQPHIYTPEQNRLMRVQGRSLPQRCHHIAPH